MATDHFQSPDYFNVDELLNEEHKLVRETVRNYVKKEISPIIEDYAQRAEFPEQIVKQPKGPFKPFTPGKIFSLGTFTLSKTSSPVALARRLHLPCVVGVLNPSMPLSTTKPRMSPVSSLAHTTATCA